jgi:pimeloyl-ACP methyl ester carboxylesterase
VRFLFSDYALDTDRRELRRGSELIPTGPQVFDTLVYLVENRERVVSKDDLLAVVWQGRVVSESTLTSQMNAVRKAVGDSGEAQNLIRTVARKGFRFIGDVREAPADPGSTPPAAPAIAGRAPHQEVSFVRAADGAHLAVATSGKGPIVVKTANWLNHVEHDWQSLWAPFLSLLSSHFRLVRYDERGNGLSDRNAADLSFEAMVRDLEAVIDWLGLERVPLIGFSQGAPVSIAYAARHPERVSRLVLYGGFCEGWRKRGIAAEIEQREAFLTLVRHGWGQENPAFRQVFTTLLVPGATNDEMQQLNELQRVAISAENFARLMRELGDIDVANMLPQVTVPTLVLHARDDAGIPFDEGLRLAREIPRARFVELESRNHLILSHEPAWQRLTQEICDFLAEDIKVK